MSDEELVAAVERHIASVHPDLGGAPAREDVLAIAEELDYPLAEPGLGA